MKSRTDALHDSLLGGMIGDSLGLPSEGLKATRLTKLRPSQLSQCLLGKFGMVSDDTEHALMTLQSLELESTNPDLFARTLGKKIRYWFACVPAGIGMATAKSCIKLWLGISPLNSGINSAGNGPTMRAGVIGVWFANDSKHREAMLDASTCISHTHPIAIDAARLIGCCASLATRQICSINQIIQELRSTCLSDEFLPMLDAIEPSLKKGDSLQAFSNRFCRREGFISGFALESTTAAVYAWLKHRHDFQAAIEAIIRCGGDTDTTAFVLGSISGIELTEDQYPSDWVAQVRDWPINPAKIRNWKTIRYPSFPLTLIRNFVFFLIVIGHGFRRLLPPY